MSVGQGVLTGDLSYVAIGREVTYGTYVTGTAGLNVLSCSLVSRKETKILEEIQTSRTNSNAIQLGKTVEGDIEAYYSPRSLAANYLLQNAFGGGPVSSVTATGETAGGGGFQHTVSIGNFNLTYSSLSINQRKGEATNGKIYEYTGLRVNELSLKAEIDDALMMSASLIGKDVTLSGNDVSTSLNTLNQRPLSFVDGRFSVETTEAGLTSTSYWNVQGFEFKISNNLNSDSGSRRIGSDVIQVLPAGLAQFELKATVRFDTTTAFDAMMAGTRLAAEFMFQGPTMTGSTARESIKLTMPFVMISDAGDPEISGPNDPLTSEISFAVLRDGTTTTGYAVKAVVVNDTASYA
jgi:hypothetical protein